MNKKNKNKYMETFFVCRNMDGLTVQKRRQRVLSKTEHKKRKKDKLDKLKIVDIKV